MVRTMPTWPVVRQPGLSAPLHWSDAGSKSQVRGSEISPSARPSLASQAASVLRDSSSTLASGR